MTTKTSQTLNKIDPTYLFLIIAILIGGYIRISQVLQSDLPLNDGGMFYVMTQNLIANGFHLPATTSYNHLNLPFAYPPLAFYLAGLLVKLTSWDLLDIIRILPAVFTVLSIPAFFGLVKALVSNKFQVIFATMMFAFIPASFDWLIMGGGLTRSPAFFFSLIALTFIYRLFTQNRVRNIVWTAVFSSLTILTHPEAALHTLAGALVFFLFFGRDKKGVVKSLIVAGLVLILTSPWWITVLSQHSLAPILAAGGTGFYDFKEVIKFLQFDITNEYRLKTIGTLGLIGLFWLVAKRKYLVPAWVMITFLAEPRSAPLYLTPCLAILASYALYKVLLFIDKKGTSSEKESIEPQPLSSRLSKGLFILLFGQWVFSAMAVATLVTLNVSMTTQDKDAFDWIKKHTPANSQFLVLTGDSPLTDPVSEWFPALTERISVATAQGHEWDTSRSFEEKLTESLNVQACSSLTYACIEDWATKNDRQLDYIYIHMPVQQGGAKLEQAYTSALGDLSVNQGKTELVYENDAVAVYKVK